jgi:membrane protein implicated in regulation of membrane protease activity
MDWDPSTWWWIVCGVLVAAEMTTGTFYLLMLAAGAAAAALCAHAGLGLTPQLVLAALVGGAAVCGWELKRRGRPAALPAGVNQEVNLDIGGRVHVEAWDPQGATRVSYRGAEWAARWVDEAPPTPGICTIRAMEGSCLLLGR